MTRFSFPELLGETGSLAACKWEATTPEVAVAATIRDLPDAVILRVDGVEARGYAPGGIG